MKKTAWEKLHNDYFDLLQDEEIGDENSVKAIKENLEMMESLKPDFWILNTNFDISEGVAEVISRVVGVETVNVLTRYRAAIGFPKSGFFRPRNVMHDVDIAICGISEHCEKNIYDENIEISDDDVLKNMDEAFYKLSKYKYWTMWIIPNGMIEAVCCDKKCDEYNEFSRILEYGKKLAGGIIEMNGGKNVEQS